MFHKSSIKLAGLYLTIMMFISLFFSISIYELSTQELDRGLRRTGQAFTIPIGPGFSVDVRNQLQVERENRYEEAKDRVLSRLVLINIFILVSGGIASYFFAVRTLRPIEESHEALERFTADASHELRTPITAMRSEIEVALMNPKLTLTQAKKQLSSNIEELEKLTQLSDGLLRLASIQNTGLNDLSSLNVETIIQEAIARTSKLAHKKKISLISDSGDRITARGDEPSLVEALVILLDNAIKYSVSDSQILIKAIKDKKNITIQVIDHGIGIKPSELDTIFERFYRADSSRTKQHVTGYGLGLSIAQNIARLHGGELIASSKFGKGSTFSLLLPIKT
jgi:signal transduction histidine kinase